MSVETELTRILNGKSASQNSLNSLGVDIADDDTIDKWSAKIDVVADNIAGLIDGEHSKITIPNCITKIGDYSFYLNTHIREVTLSDSIIKIGNAAFSGCSSLTSIILSENLTSISSNAFNSCKSLTTITIPSKITNIYDQAFSTCTSLTTVTIEAGVPPTLGSQVFKYCEKLIAIYVPEESVTEYQEATNWNAYADLIMSNSTE